MFVKFKNNYEKRQVTHRIKRNILKNKDCIFYVKCIEIFVL